MRPPLDSPLPPSSHTQRPPRAIIPSSRRRILTPPVVPSYPHLPARPRCRLTSATNEGHRSQRAASLRLDFVLSLIRLEHFEDL